MKKNKGLTYVMLVVVIGVWGKLIYDFVSSGNNAVVEFTEQYSAPIKESMNSENTEIYKLDLDYRDPFLGKIKKKRVKSKKVQVKKKETPLKELIVTWPSLTYNGMVQNKQSGKKLAMVNLNMKDLVLAEGDSLEKGFVLSGIERDSLVLSFKETSKTIFK